MGKKRPPSDFDDDEPRVYRRAAAPAPRFEDEAVDEDGFDDERSEAERELLRALQAVR